LHLHKFPLYNVHVIVRPGIVASLGKSAPEVAPQLLVLGENRSHELPARISIMVIWGKGIAVALTYLFSLSSSRRTSPSSMCASASTKNI